MSTLQVSRGDRRVHTAGRLLQHVTREKGTPERKGAGRGWQRTGFVLQAMW